MAVDWNREYKGKIIHSYLEVEVPDRPTVFSDMPSYFWWLYNNPTQASRGRSFFDFSGNLPSVSGLETQIERKQYQANKKVLEEIQKDVEPYLPYASGYLQSSAYVDAMAGTLSYGAYYAEYAFEPNTPMGTPKNYDKRVHSEARGFPVEYAVQQNMDKYRDMWLKEVLSP